MTSNRVILLSSLFVLSSCALALDSALQDVTVETPGAQNAQCTLVTNNFKYRVNPPETISVKKSETDMVIDCKAPGNRNRKVVIPPRYAELYAFNSVTGFAVGGTVDYLTGSAFEYPSKVVIDFTGVPIQPEAMPAQNAPDIRQPETYDLEEFLPGTPRLNSDKYSRGTTIKKRARKTVRFTDTDAYGILPEGSGAVPQSALNPADPNAPAVSDSVNIEEQKELLNMMDPSQGSDSQDVPVNVPISSPETASNNENAGETGGDDMPAQTYSVSPDSGSQNDPEMILNEAPPQTDGRDIHEIMEELGMPMPESESQENSPADPMPGTNMPYPDEGGASNGPGEPVESGTITHEEPQDTGLAMPSESTEAAPSQNMPDGTGNETSGSEGATGGGSSGQAQDTIEIEIDPNAPAPFPPRELLERYSKPDASQSPTPVQPTPEQGVKPNGEEPPPGL